MNLPKQRSEGTPRSSSRRIGRDSGFSLVEVTIALVILMIAVIGVAMSFTYAMAFNTGNNARSEALAVLQQEVENLRTKKFAPALRDAELAGGTKPARIVPTVSGGRYRVNIVVDDNIAMNGTQIVDTTTFKEITVTVITESPTPGWQFAVPVQSVLQRVRSN